MSLGTRKNTNFRKIVTGADYKVICKVEVCLCPLKDLRGENQPYDVIGQQRQGCRLTKAVHVISTPFMSQNRYDDIQSCGSCQVPTIYSPQQEPSNAT
jgi:hypothetical protein